MQDLELPEFLTESQYKYRAYRFLNHPSGFFSIGYQLIMMLVIMACVVLTMCFAREHKTASSVLVTMDVIMLILFSGELIVRTWASTCFSKYRGFIGVLRLASSPWFFLDLLVIVLTLSVLFFNAKENILSICLRGFRLLHFFQNRYRLWTILCGVVWIQRFQLAVCAYICLVSLFSISFIIYYVEAKENKQITCVADAVWFTLVTFTTIGYGDVVPVTKLGKVITALAMWIGVGIFSLPGGVIGAGLALKIDNDTKNRANNFRRNFAAMFLQEMWRVHSFDRKYRRYKQQLNESRNPNNGKASLWFTKSKSKHIKSNLSSQTTTTNSSHRRHCPKGSKFMAFGRCIPKTVHPYAVLFIYHIRFYRAKARFKQSEELCDENTFYETYTNNQWENAEMMRTVDYKLNHIQHSLDEQRDFFRNVFTLLASNKRLIKFLKKGGGGGVAAASESSINNETAQSDNNNYDDNDWDDKFRQLSASLTDTTTIDTFDQPSTKKNECHNVVDYCRCCRRKYQSKKTKKRAHQTSTHHRNAKYRFRPKKHTELPPKHRRISAKSLKYDKSDEDDKSQQTTSISRTSGTQ